jgi:hypothetical protein
MSYRGALIFPITAEIGRLDLTATAADPDGAGPMVSGYDADYREPVVTPSGDGLGVINRRELMVKVPAQVDGLNTDGDDLQRLQMLSSGDTKMNVMTLVFHFVDLERLGLVDLTSGRALLKEGTASTPFTGRRASSSRPSPTPRACSPGTPPRSG